jgi:methyl-accepting chemotaxis protein
MAGMNDTRAGIDSAISFARGVRSRVGFLILAAMMSVAFIFGASFYFALLSNQSALARQFPELEQVAAKLKSILLLNTAAITAIIIVSFFILASIVTARMFQPLGLLRRDLISLAGGKLPRRTERFEGGAFSELEKAWSDTLDSVHAREIREIKELTDCIASITRGGPQNETAAKLRELADRKKAFIGATEPRPESTEKKPAKDPLFIQPL